MSPFYHFNRGNLIGGPNDPNFNVQQNRSSHYGGAQAILSAVAGKHNARAGFYGFAQRDSSRLDVQANDGSALRISQKEMPSGNLEAVFFEDEYQAASWLRLNAVTAEGSGIFHRVTSIQRVNTVGGIAPATPGTVVGQEARVPYAIRPQRLDALLMRNDVDLGRDGAGRGRLQ